MRKGGGSRLAYFRAAQHRAKPKNRLPFRLNKNTRHTSSSQRVITGWLVVLAIAFLSAGVSGRTAGSLTHKNMVTRADHRRV
jgi:hypothetical protein